MYRKSALGRNNFLKMSLNPTLPLSQWPSALELCKLSHRQAATLYIDGIRPGVRPSDPKTSGLF